MTSNVQPITHNGQLVAAVLRDRAIIATDLPETERRTVEAMCVYATEILDGRIQGPYRDEDALHYATTVPPRPSHDKSAWPPQRDADSQPAVPPRRSATTRQRAAQHRDER